MVNTNQTLFLVGICILSLFVHFYNASDLSGGDDSQLAELGMLTLQNPSLYPSFPDEPISWTGLKYSRPVTAWVYASSIFLIGYNKYAIIFPAFIFSTLAAIILYFIVKSQFDDKVAMISSVLFIASPFVLAFTRIGLLHAQLIFFSMLAYLFLFRYIKTKNVVWVYLSNVCWLCNAWTTDYRGLVVAFALAPVLFKQVFLEKDSKLLKHFIISGFIVLCLYIGYMLLPLLLFNDASYIEFFLRMTKSAFGSVDSSAYLSFTDAVLAMGKYIFMSPFLGFIIVPAVFGLGYALLKIKDTKYMFWVFYLIPIIVFYFQGQNDPSRQMIFMPAFAVLATLGFVHAFENKYATFCLVGFTAVWLFNIALLFPKLFPNEWAVIGIDGQLTGMLVSLTGISILGLNLIVWATSAWFVSQFKDWRKIANLFMIAIIVVSVMFCVLVVHFGVGIYKRSDDVSLVGQYLSDNMPQDAKYSCIAGIHDKSFSFYTQKLCLFYYRADFEWVKEQTLAGNIPYFIINTYYYEGTPGLGVFDPQGELVANNQTSAWHRNYPERVEWIKENTVDVTEEVGVSQSFVVLKSKHLNIS